MCGQIFPNTNSYQMVHIVLFNILKEIYVHIILKYNFSTYFNLLRVYTPDCIFFKVHGQFYQKSNSYLKVLILYLSIFNGNFLHIIFKYILSIYFGINSTNFISCIYLKVCEQLNHDKTFLSKILIVNLFTFLWLYYVNINISKLYNNKYYIIYFTLALGRKGSPTLISLLSHDKSDYD